MVIHGHEWLLMVETLELLAIQWLGGSDFKLGVAIFSVQWRAVRSYFEFPKHI